MSRSRPEIRAVPAHDAAGAETKAEIRRVCGGVAVNKHDNPKSMLVMNHSAAYRLAVSVLATLNPELWWFDRTKVSKMVEYMLQNGWEHSEVVRAIEMPWLFTDVHHRAAALDGS